VTSDPEHATVHPNASSDAIVDVVVIGAGPAGAAAARLLASWGRDVALLTRAPSQRTLAESLPPSCVRLLDQVGVREAIDAAGFVRANGNTVRWGGGEERVELFPEGTLGYQVGRERFDAVLLAEASKAGARVTSGVSARTSPARDHEGRLPVHFSSPAGSDTLQARWVLDCSGRAGAATPGGQRVEDGPRTLALAAVWEADGWDLPDPTHTLVESYRGGWAWSVPETLGRRFVTMMLDPAVTPLTQKGEVDDQYDAHLARAEWMRARIALPARRVGRAWACDATPWCAREIVGDGVLRVGDAASFVDPLSSYGIKKALASAWLAAVVVNTALADPAMAGPATELYEARERAMYQALSRQSAELAGTAAAARADGFWEARLDAGDAVPGAAADWSPTADPQIAERVRAAFRDLKAREQITLRPSPTLHRVHRPVVEDNQIVLRDHLVGAGLPEPVRYLRSVNLVHLLRLAPEHPDVGTLYDAYGRSTHPVPFPDFLAALTTLIGTDALTLE
jgi:flavin-dependent dehydrogenase